MLVLPFKAKSYPAGAGSLVRNAAFPCLGLGGEEIESAFRGRKEGGDNCRFLGLLRKSGGTWQKVPSPCRWSSGMGSWLHCSVAL